MAHKVDPINKSILQDRNKLISLEKKDVLSNFDKIYLQGLSAKYKLGKDKSVSDIDKQIIIKLLIKVDVIPPALILAQAANESAWGTSRFALQANNYFGIWCFSKGCGLVPNARTNGDTHEVRYFHSSTDSVTYYMLLLNSHKQYAELRNIRAVLRASSGELTAIKLAEGLGNYSERGEDYIRDLINLIQYNKLHEKYPLGS